MCTLSKRHSTETKLALRRNSHLDEIGSWPKWRLYRYVSLSKWAFCESYYLVETDTWYQKVIYEGYVHMTDIGT